MVNVCWVNGEGFDCCGVRGIRASEDGLLCSINRSMGGTGDGIGLDVKHMGWYHLRVRVASIMCMVR